MRVTVPYYTHWWPPCPGSSRLQTLRLCSLPSLDLLRARSSDTTTRVGLRHFPHCPAGHSLPSPFTRGRLVLGGVDSYCDRQSSNAASTPEPESLCTAVLAMLSSCVLSVLCCEGGGGGIPVAAPAGTSSSLSHTLSPHSHGSQTNTCSQRSAFLGGCRLRAAQILQAVFLLFSQSQGCRIHVIATDGSLGVVAT